jgi:transcriptional regulator with XRE-family HTH domain
MSTFGDNLKALRLSRGYSQDRFAKEIGSNQVNVSSWETGYRTPTLATIRGIAETFHVPLSSLISVESTGIEDDLVKEISDIIKSQPKMKTILDRARFMSPRDLDAIIGVMDAILRNRIPVGEKE